MTLQKNTLREPAARQLLADNPALGGGNAWRIAAETSLTPDAVVLVADRPVTNATGQQQAEFSIRQLDALTQAWSRHYLDRGVQPRDRVVIYLEDSFLDQVLLTALAQIGAIPVLLNGKLPAEVALTLIRRAMPVGIHADAAHLSALAGRHEQSTDLPWTIDQDAVGAIGERALPDAARYHHHDEDPVLLCHSSGTTGVPKLVVWSHRQSMAGARFRLAAHPEPHDSVLLSAVPQSHSGAIAFTFYALLAGLPLIALSDQSGPGVQRAVARYRPTTVLAFNQSLAALALMELDPEDFSSVADWMNVGDSAHDAHIRALMPLGQRTVDGQVLAGSVFGDGLGSSELGWAALRRVLEPGGPVRPRYLGRRVPIAEVAVLRPDGTIAGVDEVGLLGVRSDSVAPGYWDDSDTQFRSRLSGYWLSGDLVYRDAGDDFFHVDRAVDAIHTGTGDGYSLLMEELLLLALPEVADCAVVAGRHDSVAAPVAIVRLRDARPADPAELLRRVNQALSEQGQPELSMLELARTDGDIPLGATGKTLKRQLRERYADLETYLAGRPASEVATKLPAYSS